MVLFAELASMALTLAKADFNKAWSTVLEPTNSNQASIAQCYTNLKWVWPLLWLWVRFTVLLTYYYVDIRPPQLEGF